jgi:hypothetical protein
MTHCGKPRSITASGTVTSDWPPTPPVTTITSDGLTRAALENCVGAAFFPGIEAGGIARSTPVVVKQITDLAFVEPFRLDQTQVAAGDVTLGMARPWQGDFMLCTGPESQTAVDSDVTSWWPAGRPVSIYPVDDATNKRPCAPTQPVSPRHRTRKASHWKTTQT